MIKDAPESIYMMDENFTNMSGKNKVSVLMGSVEDSGPALVSGASKSILWNSNAVLQSDFTLMKPGTEQKPFSLEVWFRPVEGAGPFYLASNAGTYDGLFWNGTSLTFNLKLSTGYVGVSYTPLNLQSMHVVGVYTGTTLLLYINGTIAAGYELSDLEKTLPIAPATTDTYIYHGAGVGLSNALATYYLPLKADQVQAHYAAGIDTRPREAASTMYGGIYERVTVEQGDIFVNRTFNDQITFENAIYTCDVTDTLSPLTDEDGDFLPGQWQTAIPLGQGGTSLNGVKVNWVGTGLFSLSTSIDGINWTIATKNNFKVPAITPGFDGTGRYLYIKVNFAGTYDGEIKSITVVGYKGMGIQTAQRAITLPDGSILYNDNDVISYSDANGVYTPTGMTIGPSRNADPVYALGLWYNSPSGEISINQTATAFYENGQPRSARTVNGRWTYVVWVFPAATGDIVITGNATIVAPTLYSSTLEAPMVNEIYYSYTGYPQFKLPSSGVFSVNTPDVLLYSNDWSSAGSG